MNIHPVEFSIVVVGQDCNPTILNPDFLRCRKIVPQAWGWELDPPAITTPPFATVRYKSGVTIVVEPNRFVVTDQGSVEKVGASKIPTIAKAYIRALPHVRYTAVGTNFRSLIEMEDANGYLKSHFLKPGVGDQGQLSLESLSLTLGYAHDDARLGLSLESATVVKATGDQSTELRGLLVAANYHREWNDYPGDKKAIAAITCMQKDSRHLSATLKELFSDLDAK